MEILLGNEKYVNGDKREDSIKSFLVDRYWFFRWRNVVKVLDDGGME